MGMTDVCRDTCDQQHTVMRGPDPRISPAPIGAIADRLITTGNDEDVTGCARAPRRLTRRWRYDTERRQDGRRLGDDIMKWLIYGIPAVYLAACAYSIWLIFTVPDGLAGCSHIS